MKPQKKDFDMSREITNALDMKGKIEGKKKVGTSFPRALEGNLPAAISPKEIFPGILGNRERQGSV